MARAETENRVGKEANIGFPRRVLRILTTAIVSPTVLRTKTIDDDHSIDKVKEVLRRGDGVVVILNHFSLGEAPRAGNVFFHHFETGSKEVVAPIASHVDKSITRNLLKLIGVNLMPINTKNSLNEDKNNDRELGKGKNEYLEASLDTLKRGGIVILPPQGTRQENLGQPEKRNIAALTLAARINNVNDFFFLFMGFEIEGVDNYSDKKVRGFNLPKKYKLHIGPCIAKDELMAKAGGKLSGVDRAAYEELRKLIPENLR